MANSNAATLTVNPAPSVTTDPANTTVCLGGSTNLTCGATGFGTLTYQWELSTNGGTTWNNVPAGAPYSNPTTASLGISAPPIGFDGYQYRCVVTGTCAPSATSNVAVLSIHTAPIITNHPTDIDGCPGSNKTFSCVASGGGLNYQWQEFVTSWNNISNGGVYAGATSSTLALNGLTPGMDGNKYRCIIVGSCTPSDTTDSAALTVNPVPNISGSSNSPVCEGKSLMLNSTSTTSGVTYGWTGPLSYTSTSSNPTITGTVLGNTGDYIVTATIAATGCTASATVPVVIKVTPAVPTVTSNSPVCTGYDIDLTATSNSGSTYSWTGPLSYSSTAQNPTITGAIVQMAGFYKVDATISGCTSAKDSVMVTIVPSPEITAYPSPGNVVCAGDTVRFFGIANNTGTGPTYQWLKNGQPIPGETSLKYVGVGLATGDTVNLRMTPGTGVSCNADIFSVRIPIVAKPLLAPAVTIKMDPAGPVWEGLLVTFTATPTDAGSKPRYQWKLNGNDIAGATSDTWSTTTFNDNDVVTCEIISDYECAQPLTGTSNQLSVPVLTSVKNTAERSDMSLFPNPNNGTFTLKGKVNKGKVQLEILNALGQVVYKSEVTSDNGELQQIIRPGEMVDGLYLLRITSGNEQDNIRFRVAN